MSAPEGGLATAEPDEQGPQETPPTGTGRGWARLGIALVAVLAVLAVVVVLLTVGRSPAPAPPAPQPQAIPAPPLPGPPAAAIAPLGVSRPLRVHVPAIFADSTTVPVGVDPQGAVQVPPTSQPMQAAWYSLGPTPGAIGPSVVLGHVNGGGRPGIFANLDKLRPGQEVLVDREDGQTAVFTVRRSITASKDAFPTQQVYGDTAGAELRLITCGGDFDAAAHHYDDNVVVFAQLTGVHRT